MLQFHLEEMNQKLQHRGPDASGTYLHNATGLGHVRLKIIDLSASANQPFHSEDGRFTMIYNGEVYNFEELKKRHQLPCRTQSDTEVILRLFEKVGTDVFSLLNGMFALAIYDHRNASVTLARDRMGKKPLFYYQKGDQVAFSSELNALKAVPELKKKLTVNPHAIRNFLHLGYIPHPLSIYKEIEKFPAGHFGIIHNGKMSVSAFWDLAQEIHKEVSYSETAASEKLDELLNDSVRIRLKSDVPFGTFLSGGIDSSLITALAQKNHSETVRSYAIGFKEKTHNEAIYAKAVAKELKTIHTEFTVSEKEALQLVPKMLSAYGEPYGDSSAIPSLMVAALASKEVKMVLSGDGGDELFMGYGFYNWAERLNHPVARLLRYPISKGLQLGNERMNRAGKLFEYPNERLKSHVFSQEQYYFSEAEVDQLLLEKSDILRALNEEPKCASVLSAREKQSLFDLYYYLPDDLLTKVDIASMQSSLEVRVPLLDYRVVQFALNLEEHHKIKGGDQKYILKKLLYQYLPSQLFDRPKQGFSIPLAKWLRGDLSYLIKDYLAKEVIENCGLVDYKEVEKILNRFRNGTDYYYTRVWALVVLHHWFLHHEK